MNGQKKHTLQDETGKTVLRIKKVLLGWLSRPGTNPVHPVIRTPGVQGRLGGIFLAFLLLLVSSVTATFYGLETQKEDGHIINLAGRQRMLLQQMTNQALEISTHPDRDNTGLQNAAADFDQTLLLLSAGGKAVDYTGKPIAIAAPRDPVLIAELEIMRQEWFAFQTKINHLLIADSVAESEQSGGEIAALAPAMVRQADRIVRSYEAVSSSKLARLRAFQLASLAVGLTLLSVAWWVTRKSIVHPVALMQQATERIGSGDMDTPLEIPAVAAAELQGLGETINRLQSQIQASQKELQEWAALLEGRVQQRTREHEALAEVSREINSHLSIDVLLTSITEKAKQLTHSEVASLCLLDKQGKILSLHAASGPEAAIAGSQSPVENPYVQNVLQMDSAQPCGLQRCEGFCQIIGPAYRTSHLAAPLRTKTGLIGALCVGSSKPDAFRPEMELVLTRLAGAAAVALENSRLYQQAEMAATLEERQRIAAEMHDGLLQTLSFLRIMVSWSQSYYEKGDYEKAYSALQQVERAEEQAEKEIRKAIASMQDDFPANDTLQDKLLTLAKELSAMEMRPPVEFQNEVVLPIVLSRQESEQVLRVVREALLNSQHYSQANLVSLRLQQAGSELVVTIEDNGVGFNPDANSDDGRSHFGIKIMHARAARLGGKLRVQSAPGTGSVVQLSWVPASAQPEQGG